VINVSAATQDLRARLGNVEGVALAVAEAVQNALTQTTILHCTTADCWFKRVLTCETKSKAKLKLAFDFILNSFWYALNCLDLSTTKSPVLVFFVVLVLIYPWF